MDASGRSEQPDMTQMMRSDAPHDRNCKYVQIAPLPSVVIGRDDDGDLLAPDNSRRDEAFGWVCVVGCPRAMARTHK
jgi:hypothetical protein